MNCVFANCFGGGSDPVFPIPSNAEAIQIENVSVGVVGRGSVRELGGLSDAGVLVEFVGFIFERSIGLGGACPVADGVVGVGGLVRVHEGGGEFRTGVVTEGVGGGDAWAFVETLGAAASGIVGVVEGGD